MLKNIDFIACMAFVATLTPIVNAAATPDPGIVEIDLIFPRNETYQPVNLMPVVFAMQNSALAFALDLHVKWELYEIGNAGLFNNMTLPGGYTGGVSEDGNLNISASDSSSSVADPYLAVGYIAVINSILAAKTPEKTWYLSWTVATPNCSQPHANGSYPPQYTDLQQDSLIFTTNDGGQAPDLQTATSAGTCGSTQHVGFNVTMLIPNDILGVLHPSACAMLGPSPTTANTCMATIDSAAASSISAAVSASATADGYHTPTTTPKSDASGLHGRALGWLIPGLLSLMFY